MCSRAFVVFVLLMFSINAHALRSNRAALVSDRATAEAQCNGISFVRGSCGFMESLPDPYGGNPNPICGGLPGYAGASKKYGYIRCYDPNPQPEPAPEPEPFSCPSGSTGTTVSSKKLRSVCMAYNGGHCAAQVTNSSLDSGLYDLSYTFTGVVCDPSAPDDIDPTPDPQPAPDPTPDPTPDPEPNPDPEPTPVVCQPPRYEVNGACVSPPYPNTSYRLETVDYDGDPSAVFKIETAKIANNFEEDLVAYALRENDSRKRYATANVNSSAYFDFYTKTPKIESYFYPNMSFSDHQKMPDIIAQARAIYRNANFPSEYEYVPNGSTSIAKCKHSGGRIQTYESIGQVVGMVKYDCNVVIGDRRGTGTIEHKVMSVKFTHKGYDHGEGDGNDGSDGGDSSGDGLCDPTKQVCPIDIRNQTNKLVEGLEAQTDSLQGAIQAVGTGISGVSNDITSLDGSIQSLGIKLDTIANNTNPGEAQPLDGLLENSSGVFSDVTAFGNARTQEQADLASQYSQLSNEYMDSATSIEDKADTLFTSIKNRVINTYPEADCEGLAYAFDTNHEPLRITCEDTSFFRVGMLFFLSGYLLLDAYHLFRSKKDTV